MGGDDWHQPEGNDDGPSQMTIAVGLSADKQVW
jgi:hypothetical protein